MAHGGARPGAGRKPGSPNKTGAELRELARLYGPSALKELARLAEHAESESARVQAIGMLLDRGYGKPAQPVDGDGEGGPIPFERIKRIIIDT